MAHRSLPLCAVEAKIRSTGQVLQGVLNSGLEIIVMHKHIWEDLGFPIQSDHTMKMLPAITSVNSMIEVLENLALDFGAGKVMVQVQILACTNFDLQWLKQLSQCLHVLH